MQKTIEVFDELGGKDPDFLFRVQSDGESGIRNLMWTTGDSRVQAIACGWAWKEHMRQKAGLGANAETA